MDLTVLANLIKPLAPVVGGLLGGPIGAAALGALASALGTEATPEAVAEAVQADPDKAKAVLADVEAKQAAALSELQERLADVQDARATTVKLVEAGSSIAWGAPIVSVLVVAGFMAVLLALFWRALPENQVVLVMIGALASEFRGVTAYWLGSSIGSKDKDAMLATLAKAASPAAIVTDAIS